ncbi:hypothetical protein B0H19DRAFT_1096562 [Mycena capillaripes]|nr:hypothetical protein B0H19DRAFT_1096562 [Mycena capillaripes]
MRCLPTKRSRLYPSGQVLAFTLAVQRERNGRTLPQRPPSNLFCTRAVAATKRRVQTSWWDSWESRPSHGASEAPVRIDRSIPTVPESLAHDFPSPRDIFFSFRALLIASAPVLSPCSVLTSPLSGLSISIQISNFLCWPLSLQPRPSQKGDSLHAILLLDSRCSKVLHLLGEDWLGTYLSFALDGDSDARHPAAASRGGLSIRVPVGARCVVVPRVMMRIAAGRRNYAVDRVARGAAESARMGPEDIEDGVCGPGQTCGGSGMPARRSRQGGGQTRPGREQ